METVALTESATALLRRRLAGEWVGVTEESRPLYRELMAAGLMYPVSTLLHGAEGYYRPTDAACDLRETGAISGPGILLPSPGAVPSPRG